MWNKLVLKWSSEGHGDTIHLTDVNMCETWVHSDDPGGEWGHVSDHGTTGPVQVS